MWYLYILECKNGTLYTGITNDVSRRIKEHKQGYGGRFTKIAGVDRLLFKEAFKTKTEAINRESQIKGWTRRKKMALIRTDLTLLKKL